MPKPTVKIIQNEIDPEPVEIIAASIIEIAAAMRKINSTRLSRKAIVVLIQSESRLARKDIELVLNNLEELDLLWLKKP